MTHNEHKQWHDYILAVEQYLKELKEWLNIQPLNEATQDIGTDPPPPPPAPPGH